VVSSAYGERQMRIGVRFGWWVNWGSGGHGRRSTRRHGDAEAISVRVGAAVAQEASAATSHAAGAQAVRQSRIQTARDQVLLVSEILWLPDARSAPRRTHAGGSLL